MAELALLGVTASVAFGFGRLFDDAAWVMPLFLTAMALHGVSAGVRRLGLGIFLQVAAVALTVLLVLGWSVAPDTLRLGLPTGDTFGAFADAIDQAASDYPTARAPTPTTDGFILASILGLALVALMADIAAFSLRAPLQALVPPFTLFTLCSLLGSGEHRITSAVLFVVATLGFTLCVRGIDAERAISWLPGDARRGPDALMRVGGVLISVAAALTLVIGPALPGAADEGLWTWRGGGGDGKRFIMSPLVDIRARLVNQSREVAFVVESPVASYWRMMALDDFDGSTWTVDSRFRPVDGNFRNVPGRPSDTRISHQIKIRSLSSEYLPAAFQPVAIDIPEGEVTWDDHSATLLLDERAGDGFEYIVESVLPDHTAEQLRAISGAVPPSVADRYLQLPPMDPRVADLAAQITAGATTPYDRALLLQDHFRDNFTYSTEIPEGSGEDQIVAFLFEQRQGYCEQFAASYAAMARSVGLPSRVAVGFTEGDQSAARPEFFTVRGEDSHAWPEVWFPGAGWVPFEPTPGRVSPGSEAWTNLSPEADGPSGGETTTPTLPEDATATTLPDDFGEDLFPEMADGAGGGVSDEGDWKGPTVLIWAAAAVAVAVVWVVLISGLALLRRDLRRRRVADHGTARVQVAWTEVVEALARRHAVPRASETYREYAQRAGASLRRHHDELHELAALTTGARYAPGPAADVDVARSIELANRLVRATTERLPLWRRLVGRADPRTVLGARPRRTRQQATVVTTT